MSRIIAIDYGRKRTGIAVSDTLQMIANGLTTVPTHQLLQFLLDYVAKEPVERILVGLPKQMNNEASENMKNIEPFVRSLKKKLPDMPVEYVDERFTSVLAHRTMLEAGLKKKDRQNKALVDEITKHLPEGPAYYDEDMITDQPERVIAAEMIREKVLTNTRDEIPHSVAVEVEEFKVRANNDIYIRATIFVERESQKGIVIGAKGSLLKKIGLEARSDIEALLGDKVFLDLWVKVKPDWRNKDKALKQFGYSS